MEHTNDEENDIEEILEPQAHGGSLKREKKKIDGAGLSYYGESFIGYQKLEEVRDLIPAFKDYYYQEKIKDRTRLITHLLREFNEQIAEVGRKFHPYTKNIVLWKKKWDKDILQQQGMMVEVITPKKHVQQILKTRASEDDNGITTYNAPAYESIEAGLQTLGGELVNDAMQMLRDDQALEEVYESDELMKRKAYIVNVFGQVTKMVHGKAALLLKASQEKRETASFLMDLMKRASSGKMGVDEITSLKSNYQPEQKPQNVTSV